MPRANTRPEIILCLGKTATSRACGVPLHVVNDACLAGDLIVYQIGSKQKIKVWGEGGIQQWVESMPRANPRKRKVSQ